MSQFANEPIANGTGSSILSRIIQSDDMIRRTEAHLAKERKVAGFPYPTLAQYRVLAMLRDAEAPNHTAIWKALHITPAVATGLIDRLQLAGLVERYQPPWAQSRDRRPVRVRITDQGRAVLDQTERILRN